MSDYLPPVVIEVEGREEKLTQSLNRAKAQVRAFVAEVGRLNATIKVDAKLKDGALAEIRRRITDGPAAKLKVDLQLATGQRDQIRAQLEERPIDATVRPKMDQAALRRVQTVLRELGKRIDVQIRPTMDQGSQARVQTRLDRLSQNRTVTIRTRVIGDANRLPGRGGGDDGGGGDAGGAMATLISLAPALAPIAAEAVAVAGAVASATVAVGAFGAAVKPQLTAMSGLADAQSKYNAAVAKYGAGSQQAAQAQQAMSQALAGMPAQTRQAAGAFLMLKDDFKSWSDGLAKFTMKPVTQGIDVLDAILPKLSPLVKDTSTQFTRLTTMLAGGVNSGAFDGLMNRFTTFTNGVLKGAVDGVVHFVRVLSEGGSSNAFSQFMAYAKANAPLVKETLKNLAEAITNIVKASSQAGPGMLTLVNAFAKLVASVPPSLLAGLMQLAAAFKLIKLAGAGLSPVTSGLQSLKTKLIELRAVSVAAGGGLAGLKAAFLSLSTAAKGTVVLAVLAGLAAATYKLSSMTKEARVSINDLSRAIEDGLTKGKISSSVLDDLRKAQQGLTKDTDASASGWDRFWYSFTHGGAKFSDSATSAKAAANDFRDLGKAIGEIAENKGLDTANQALALLAKQGVHIPTKYLKDYNSAVADAALESKLTAMSMGLFGDAAVKTSDRLAKQKASADGLRQSIQALNDVNRQGLGGMIAFEQSIADAAQAAKDDAGALSMHNGQLNLSSQKARDAASKLQDLADKTDAAAAASRESTNSWQGAIGIYQRGRSELIKQAQAMGLSADQAKTLADQILKIPDKAMMVKMNTEDATRDLNAFNAAVRRAPGAKSVTLKTLSAEAEKVLSTFGYHVTHLKNGSVTVTAATGSALAAIVNVQGAIDSLAGKIVNVGIHTVFSSSGSGGAPTHKARGGPIRLAGGGNPDGGRVVGPGSETSDSIPAMLSNGEYVVRASSVRKYGERFLNALNSGHLRVAGFARGGLSQTVKDARSQLGYGVGLSYFGRTAGYRATSMQHNLGAPQSLDSLVSSLNDLRSQIKSAFSGRTESSLLKQLDKAGKSLLNYDKQLTKVTASLESARNKLDDLKNSAAQLKDSVASSVMQNAGIVTQAPQEGFGLTSQDVLNNMSAQVSKSLTFSKQLQELKKRGLSADLLQQIAAAGVDQGGATATALVGASSATIKQLNNMQSQLKSSANAAGSAVSDAMYGAGIRAAEGLVQGLEKKQKAIQDAMLRIATSMQAAIKKALGIRSPSTVMAKLGDFTAQGFAQGIARSSKHAAIAAQGMAMSVRQGATLAGTPTLAGVSAGGWRGGMVVHNHHYEFRIEGNVRTVDGLARDIEAAFLRRGMRNPATYPAYKR